MKVLLIGIAAMTAALVQAAELTVDFSKDSGALNHAIHSSGWAPRSYPRSIQNDDEAIKAMNLKSARTHDWALVNSGQRVIDYQYIFPLINKDPKDPSNYYFGPTDHLLKLSRNLGLEIFYRLGTSIEHTGNEVHFNALVPEDFDKVAEIFAATVRHYNKGWNNGYEWNIKYWEIWNEPDLTRAMWFLPGKDGEELRKMFIKFFVVCLKRLKSEFPDIKVGGPALTSAKVDYFRDILTACKEAGVAPDFLSWHYYGYNTDVLFDTGVKMRKLCKEMGFANMELIINEYHYLISWDGIHGRNSTPAMVKRAQEGPTGHNNIDAACFYLEMLSRFQKSEISQAFYYGCAHQGNWGYMDHLKQYNKPYFAAKLFGQVCADYSRICELVHQDTYTTLALRSKDGKKVGLLLTDYRGFDQLINVSVKGLGKIKRVSAIVLDDTRDNMPCKVDLHDNVVSLVKADKNSAAYLITFEF
jgi:hypothetical protein